MIINSLAVNRLMKAVFAMAILECQLARAIQSDYEAPQHSGMIESLHADETLDHIAANPGKLLRANMAQEVVHCVRVRHLLLTTFREIVEVVQGKRAVQLESNSPARPELQHKHHETHPRQELLVINDLLAAPCVSNLAQPLGQPGKKVSYCFGQRSTKTYSRFPR